jgi:hypothetical protein
VYADLEHNLRLKEEFLVFDPLYEESMAELGERVRVLSRQTYEREASGRKTSCSHGTLNEI